MYEFAAQLNILLGVLVILAGIASIVLLVILFTPSLFAKYGERVRSIALPLAGLIVLAAIVGSLTYSEVLGYTPCKLCWYQRILMYPQILLIGLALWKKDRGISHYILPLSGIGFVIALYHYLMQAGIAPELTCAVVGFSASCSERFVMTFGFITIPFMALIGFLLVSLLMVFLMRKSKHVAEIK